MPAGPLPCSVLRSFLQSRKYAPRSCNVAFCLADEESSSGCTKERIYPRRIFTKSSSGKKVLPGQDGWYLTSTQSDSLTMWLFVEAEEKRRSRAADAPYAKPQRADARLNG